MYLFYKKCLLKINCKDYIEKINCCNFSKMKTIGLNISNFLSLPNNITI
ncbi:hypothetical protein A1OE_1368 [Candidatus Endolissoclinum faulkneri L2]|uniref:Uncharacterized protein n=1 Tax=Candidatus Endolissoclinum faulkneri L2 TaxID=1193729 RepID=K7YSM6_9PROT|nr:hypothetical protein A1OE_1368 [Candidatus Endolissoclinum faulkneri L2]